MWVKRAGCGGFGEDCRACYDNCGACAIGVLRGGLFEAVFGVGIAALVLLARNDNASGGNGWFCFLSLRGAAGDAAIPCLTCFILDA